ncbi:MAG: ankyrin repeat domain-containing protein [Alphaproteobacteria bacterium]
MSDHDITPDPIDTAYAQAEALLADEVARAARRARLLDAVTREPARPAASILSWRRAGGWLMAASVAALVAIVSIPAYRPFAPRSRTAQAPASPEASSQNVTASLAPAEPALAPEPSRSTMSQSPSGDKPSSSSPPPVSVPAPVAQQSKAVPVQAEAAPPPPPPPPPPRVAAPLPPSPAPLPAPPPATARLEAPAAAAAGRGGERVAGAAGGFGALDAANRSSIDQAERLRAAAAAGRASEVEMLLAQGVAVDAADADGNTALMFAIQKRQPAVAAILRRYGASLDLRNKPGQRARDMAAALGDMEMNRALGLEP